MKALSAGLIIECPSGYLLCHPTGRSRKPGNWDIPKGHVEGSDRTYLETCLRELKEETDIVLPPQVQTSIRTIGFTAYNPKKDLYLFFIQLPYDIDADKLTCRSMFEKDGRMIPEMDGYMLSRDISYLYPNLQKVFIKVLNLQQ
jgi:8-oxo-dGTP pyrophosphatase MutT (NUDIX family)